MKFICKKSSNQEMFATSLSSCSRYDANFKFDWSVFAIYVLQSAISEGDHSPNHARSPTSSIYDEPQTSLMHAFVFPGVNKDD
jgi:hypothetical protein